MRQAMPDEASTRFEWHGHVALHGHVCIADLPVAFAKVGLWPFFVRAGNDVQASIFDCGRIYGDPNPNNGGVNGVVEICAILVPRFFAANARGFDKAHVLE